MMQSVFGASLPGPAQPTYVTDSILDDLSRQLASSTTRRLSRGSHGQRGGNAMRVVKPSSANNSPRNSLMQQRRRTLINDGLLFRRSQPPLEHSYLPTPDADVYAGGCTDPMKRASRPVSWHPSSSQFPQPQVYVQQPSSTQYPFPTYNEAEFFTNIHQFPPTPAAYSGYTSPSAAFSPLSLPYSGYEAPQYFPTGDWSVSAAPASEGIECQSTTAFAPLPTQSVEAVGDCSMDWNRFVANGFNQVTAPPTPEDFVPLNQPEPTLASDESIPYQPLEEEEAEGEVLIGMGLYDAPEKVITTLNHNGSTLLGSSFDYPEPTGKGLKLEAAWEPPAMDDDEEDDQEGEEDAEQEEDDS